MKIYNVNPINAQEEDERADDTAAAAAAIAHKSVNANLLVLFVFPTKFIINVFSHEMHKSIMFLNDFKNGRIIKIGV